MKVGKSRSHIANFLRLLTLPASIKEDVSRGTLSMGHARALVGVKEKKQQLELARLSVEQEWSVRELEAAIQKQPEKQPDKEKASKAKKRDPYLESMEETLRDQFKTTVRIKQQKDKGRIELMYYNRQDLERLLELLQHLA
jgi:ParB family chromosome partitioning protein